MTDFTDADREFIHPLPARMRRTIPGGSAEQYDLPTSPNPGDYAKLDAGTDYESMWIYDAGSDWWRPISVTDAHTIDGVRTQMSYLERQVHIFKADAEYWRKKATEGTGGGWIRLRDLMVGQYAYESWDSNDVADLIEQQANEVGERDTAIVELTEALRYTVDYVGLDMLPPIEGWSWYDAMLKHAPGVATAFSLQYEQLKNERETVKAALEPETEPVAMIVSGGVHDSGPTRPRLEQEIDDSITVGRPQAEIDQQAEVQALRSKVEEYTRKAEEALVLTEYRRASAYARLADLALAKIDSIGLHKAWGL